MSMDNVLSFLHHHAVWQPGKVALQCPLGGWTTGGLQQRSLTYGELERESAAMAGALHQLGLRPGGRVLLLVPFSIELYLVLLALLRLGATAVVVDPSLGLRNLLALAPALELAAVVVQSATRWLRLLPGLRRVPIHASVSCAGWGLASLEQRMASGAPRLPTHPVAAGAPALITFTSGSTGRPRGVVRSHGSLRRQLLVLGAHLGIGPADVDLSPLPIFLLNSLAVGATCVLPRLDRRGRANPVLLARQIEAAQVTSLSGSPGFFFPLVRHCLEQGIRLLSVRVLFTGGAPVPPRLLEQLRVVLPRCTTHVVYGSTEAEPIAGIPGQEAARLSASGLAQGQGVCVGRPVPGLDLLLLRPRRGPIGEEERPVSSLSVAPGEIGEVVVRAEHVVPGYLDDPEEERRCKIHEEGTVWHRTGDLAWQDAQGRLWHTGRLVDRLDGQYPADQPVDSLQAEGPVDALPFVQRSALLRLSAGRGAPGKTVIAVQPRRMSLLELLLRQRPWEEQVRERLQLHGLRVDLVVFLPQLPVDRRHRSRIDRQRLRASLEKNLLKFG